MSESSAGRRTISTIDVSTQEQRIQDLEAAIQKATDHLAEMDSVVKTVDVILSQLTNRVLQLEGNYFHLKNAVAAGDRLSGEHAPLQTDEALRKLANRVVANGKPYGTYFNTRFRD